MNSLILPVSKSACCIALWGLMALPCGALSVENNNLSMHPAALERIVSENTAKIRAGKEAQEVIDRIADDADTMLMDYRETLRKTDNLLRYNTSLDKQIARQTTQIKELEDSVNQVTIIERQIVPLMQQMIKKLKQFIQLDMPFDREERQQRVGFLEASIDRPDISVAEKFRQVLSAYAIELEYGRKVNHYQTAIAVDGQVREVNLLQVGRIALAYQTIDRNTTGYWNKHLKQWLQLDDKAYRHGVRQGLRIAKKQAGVDMLSVPVLISVAATATKNSHQDVE